MGISLIAPSVGEAPVLNDRQCSLCSQISGRSANDLIATLLPDQPYVRRVMLETPSFAAIPSLGPLAPGHSLLCPKAHLRSFAELDRGLDDEFLTAKEELRGILTRLYQVGVYLFEHGMTTGGTRTVCTVEHAHMHFVPLPSQPSEESLFTDGRWVEFEGTMQALRELTAGKEYILCEMPGGSARILRSEAGTLESQYMRRAFAKSMGHAEEWDWRASPNPVLTDEAWRHFADFRPGGRRDAVRDVR